MDSLCYESRPDATDVFFSRFYTGLIMKRGRFFPQDVVLLRPSVRAPTKEQLTPFCASVLSQINKHANKAKGQLTRSPLCLNWP